MAGTLLAGSIRKSSDQSSVCSNLIDGALGLTLRVRVALQARQAAAGGRPVPLAADSVQPAGTWSAGVCDLRRGRRGYNVTSVSGHTNLEGNISNVTKNNLPLKCENNFH